MICDSQSFGAVLIRRKPMQKNNAGRCAINSVVGNPIAAGTFKKLEGVGGHPKYTYL
jgi:hypothetical protein